MERLRADRVLVFGWVVWLVCLIVLPISPIFLGDTQSVLLLVFSNVAFWIGLRSFELGDAWPGPGHGPRDPVQFVDALLKLLLPVGCIALLVRGFDYFVLRDVPLFGSFTDVRQALEMAGPTLASALYGLLSPVMLAAGIFGVFCFSTGRRTFRVYASTALLPIYPSFSFLTGARSALALVVALGLIACLISSPRFNRRQILFFSAILLCALFITMGFFVSRLQESGIPIEDRVNLAGYNQLVPLRDWVLLAAREAHPKISAASVYVLSLGQYLVHGVFEFFALIRDKNPSDPMLWGRYQFAIFDQFGKVFDGISGRDQSIDLVIFNPRSALYTTFWGPAFIDFKYLMPIYAWAFGFVISFFQKRVSQGDVVALPLHCLFIFQVGISVMANGLAWAAAIYANVVFLAAWLAYQCYLIWKPKPVVMLER